MNKELHRDIQKRLGRLINDREVNHRHRRDAQEALRILKLLVDGNNAKDIKIARLQVKANLFDEVENLVETMPQVQKALAEAMGDA